MSRIVLQSVVSKELSFNEIIFAKKKSAVLYIRNLLTSKIFFYTPNRGVKIDLKTGKYILN